MQYIYDPATTDDKEVGIIRHIGEMLDSITDEWDSLSDLQNEYYDDSDHYIPIISIKMGDVRDDVEKGINRLIDLADGLGWKPVNYDWHPFHIAALVKNDLTIS